MFFVKKKKKTHDSEVQGWFGGVYRVRQKILLSFLSVVIGYHSQGCLVVQGGCWSSIH